MQNSSQVTPDKSVLVIEANDLILTWLIPAVEKLGCTVTKARDLRSAQTIIEQNQPLDLVILGDLTRPSNMNTNAQPAEMRLLLQLRTNPSYPALPVIVFTSANWLAEAHKAGATAHLEKPAGSEDLEAVILPHLRPSSQTQTKNLKKKA